MGSLIWWQAGWLAGWFSRWLQIRLVVQMLATHVAIRELRVKFSDQFTEMGSQRSNSSYIKLRALRSGHHIHDVRGSGKAAKDIGPLIRFVVSWLPCFSLSPHLFSHSIRSEHWEQQSQVCSPISTAANERATKTRMRRRHPVVSSPFIPSRLTPTGHPI